MKEAMSLTAFAIVALCFALFVVALKPRVVTAATGSDNPAHCFTKASSSVTICQPRVFARLAGARPHTKP
jgi:hypothetical protein